METIEPFNLLYEMPWDVYLTPVNGFDSTVYTRPSEIQLIVAESMKRTSIRTLGESVSVGGSLFLYASQ